MCTFKYIVTGGCRLNIKAVRLQNKKDHDSVEATGNRCAYKSDDYLSREQKGSWRRKKTTAIGLHAF